MMTDNDGYSMLVAMILITVTVGVTSVLVAGAQFVSQRRSLENKVAAQAQVAAMVERAAREWAGDKVGESSWDVGEVRSVDVQQLVNEGYLPERFVERGTPLGPTYRSYVRKKEDNDVIMVTVQTGEYTEYGLFEPSAQARASLRSNIGRQYRENFAGSRSVPANIKPDKNARPFSRAQQEAQGQARGAARGENVDVSDVLKEDVNERSFGVIRGFDTQGGRTTLGEEYQGLKTRLARKQIVASESQFEVLDSKVSRSAELIDETGQTITNLEQELKRLGDVSFYNQLREKTKTLRNQQEQMRSNCTTMRRNITGIAPSTKDPGEVTTSC